MELTEVNADGKFSHGYLKNINLMLKNCEVKVADYAKFGLANQTNHDQESLKIEYHYLGMCF